MTQPYIYLIIGIVIGFSFAIGIHIMRFLKITKAQKSLGGFLESEKLIKERLQKENIQLHHLKENLQLDFEAKIQELNIVIKMMDNDILLLQKNNEETEALLNAKEPVVHTLKLKLIEANNTIARFKAQMAGV